MLTAITGINWGDEGKGRMVDLISQEYDIVARYQGGNNAGHTPPILPFPSITLSMYADAIVLSSIPPAALSTKNFSVILQTQQKSPERNLSGLSVQVGDYLFSQAVSS